MKIVHKEILIGVISFILGTIYMHFDSRAYYESKFLSNREFYWKIITTYQDSLKVSNEMVSNSYEAFYTISECSTKAGCNFLKTTIELRILNREREQLKEKYDALDAEIKLFI